MMEVVMEVYECLWTFVSFGNSVDGIMKITSVNGKYTNYDYSPQDTQKALCLIEVGWDIMLV